jgi:hypothetical protein
MQPPAPRTIQKLVNPPSSMALNPSTELVFYGQY